MLTLPILPLLYELLKIISIKFCLILIGIITPNASIFVDYFARLYFIFLVPLFHNFHITQITEYKSITHHTKFITISITRGYSTKILPK